MTPAQETPDLPMPVARPLDGIRVLDLTRFIAGPYCTMLLADQGADVVKVEPPRGEDTRRIPPMLGPGVSGYFVRYNRSKRSVCLDMKSPARACAAFRELVRGVDVLVENFRPGVLERMGSGLGRAASAQQPAGLLHDHRLRVRGLAVARPRRVHPGRGGDVRRGDPPGTVGRPAGGRIPRRRHLPPALACAAISSALSRRERDGEGSRVDIAMYDAMLAMNERAIAMSAMLGRKHPARRARPTSSDTGGDLRGPRRLREHRGRRRGHLATVLQAIDRPDWAQDECSGRHAARGRLRQHHPAGIHAWLSDKSADEAVELLTTAGVPSTALRLPLEVLESRAGAGARYDHTGRFAGRGGRPGRRQPDPVRHRAAPRRRDPRRNSAGTPSTCCATGPARTRPRWPPCSTAAPPGKRRDPQRHGLHRGRVRASAARDPGPHDGPDPRRGRARRAR